MCAEPRALLGNGIVVSNSNMYGYLMYEDVYEYLYEYI